MNNSRWQPWYSSVQLEHQQIGSESVQSDVCQARYVIYVLLTAVQTSSWFGLKPCLHDATFVEQHWCSRTSMEIGACLNILQHWWTKFDNVERPSTRFDFSWLLHVSTEIHQCCSTKVASAPLEIVELVFVFGSKTTEWLCCVDDFRPAMPGIRWCQCSPTSPESADYLIALHQFITASAS